MSERMGGKGTKGYARMSFTFDPTKKHDPLDSADCYGERDHARFEFQRSSRGSTN